MGEGDGIPLLCLDSPESELSIVDFKLAFVEFQ
jgi:hypothetical protein